MHILLTDVLICPRCGPSFGLIVLAEQIDDRQVERGHLGCPNCRQNYPIEDGVVDLRFGAADESIVTAPSTADPERAYRIAALMGVTTANANLLIIEEGGGLPGAVAEIVPQAHIIGASPTGASPASGVRGGEDGFLSRVLVDSRLPFRSGSMRGVAFAGIFSPAMAAEALRILMPGARLVVDSAGGQTADELRSLGFRIELEQDRVVVAAVPGPV